MENQFCYVVRRGCNRFVERFVIRVKDGKLNHKYVWNILYTRQLQGFAELCISVAAKKVGYDEPMSSSVKVSYATYGQIKSHLYLLLKMYIYFCGFGEYIAIANPSNFNIPFESLRGIIN